MKKTDIDKTINEIYFIFCSRNYNISFTLESVNNLFEIGNEVFQKNNPEEVERIANRPKTKAPDLFDDEPFSLERTLQIYSKFEGQYSEINPDLIHRIFELNSKLAWDNYRKKYYQYIKDVVPQYPEDEYLNYLAAVVYFEEHNFQKSLEYINLAVLRNPSCAVYIHLKASALMQNGDMEKARTYLYQALFLVELQHDVPPKHGLNKKLYPNYPIEFHTNADVMRTDLRKLDNVERNFKHSIMPLINSTSY
jgi:tetratricopeptide (TPR) repeat protein